MGHHTNEDTATNLDVFDLTVFFYLSLSVLCVVKTEPGPGFVSSSGGQVRAAAQWPRIDRNDH